MTEATNQPINRGLFLSLRVKMLVVFSLLFAAGFAAAFYWFYNFATDQALGRIEEDLLDTLDGAIAGINGDEFAELAQAEPGESGYPEENAFYDAHQRWMAQIIRIEPRAIPYTFIPTDVDREVLWIGDGFREIPERQPGTAFKESYDAGDSLLYDGLQSIHARLTFQPDQWGNWVSAYGPIRNSTGEVVGGMGIDFDAAYVEQVQQEIQDTVIYAFVIAYGLLFISVFVFSTYLTRPIIDLTEVAREIGEGDYDQDLSKLTSARMSDEITTLARVIDLMVEKVAEREESLKKKVASLQIMIDEQKRDAQVAELTGNEFFQDMKARAEELRRTRKGSLGESEKPSSSE
ncbi:MAG TPA: HAMP domain-containing protein [Aggregatilineales bacterium]|nr:HAMP domain-containing protein [Aggregatilineales bacterium]